MTTPLDIFPILFWPFVVSAAAWAIALCALAEPNELSAIVRNLTSNLSRPRPNVTATETNDPENPSKDQREPGFCAR